MKISFFCAVFFVVCALEAHASQDTIGSNGINSVGLLDGNNQPLIGTGIAIGQLENHRPGDPNFDQLLASVNTAVHPTAVFFRHPNSTTDFSPTRDSRFNGQMDNHGDIDDHAENVAGVMISAATASPLQPSTPTGVAPGASLYSAGFDPPIADPSSIEITAYFLSQQADLRAINISFGGPPTTADGNSQFTLFLDWSASTLKKTLYVVAGNEDSSPNTVVPTDNFNGLTVGSASKLNGAGKYLQVSQFNYYHNDPYTGDVTARTIVDLIAPGSINDAVAPSIGGVSLTALGNNTENNSGTSVAAPMATATVALLQQYGERKKAAAVPGWTNADFRQHQVMKAVLMNSTNKLIDNNTITGPQGLVPMHGLLDMDRTVLMQDGVSTWLNSPARDKTPNGEGESTPLDPQMGTGELDASRALRQFSAGEFHSTENGGRARVPVMGWDFGHSANVGQNNTYVFNQVLTPLSYVSITLAYDRKVEFDSGGAGNVYHVGDTFATSGDVLVPGHDQFSDLYLYLIDTTNGNTTVADSICTNNTVEHIFFQLPDVNHQYEFQIKQHNNNGGPVDYAVAWWALGTGPKVTLGDINQDNIVDVADISSLMSALTNLSGYEATNQITDPQDFLDIADINQDGFVNNLDIQELINMVANNADAGALPGSNLSGGEVVPVPEPSSFLLLTLSTCGLGLCNGRGFCRPAA